MTSAGGNRRRLERWGPVAVAVVLDVAFVLLWWAFVFMPGDGSVKARELEALRWGDDPVQSIRRLAPDGAYALVRTGGDERPRWQLVTWAALGTKNVDGDVARAAAGKGAIDGTVEQAVWVPERRWVLALGKTDSGASVVWRWVPDGSPTVVANPHADPWIDSQGLVQPGSKLRRRGGELAYVGDFIVHQRRKSFARLSRVDGKVISDTGKAVVPGLHGLWSPSLVYETPTASAAQMLVCHRGGALCRRRSLGGSWGSGASAVAVEPAERLVAVCKDGRVRLFETPSLDPESKDASAGLPLGTFDVASGCERLTWLPAGLLFVAGANGAGVWALEDAP